jgi:hypothetical protein
MLVLLIRNTVLCSEQVCNVVAITMAQLNSSEAGAVNTGKLDRDILLPRRDFYRVVKRDRRGGRAGGHLGGDRQSSAMRMKRSIAATKEYLIAAANMEKKMSASCSSSEAPAQASAPVSTTAVALAGSGERRSRHRMSDSDGRDSRPCRSFSPPSTGGPPPPPFSPDAARATERREPREWRGEGEIGLGNLGWRSWQGRRRMRPSGARAPVCAAAMGGGRRRSDHEGEEVDNGSGGLEWSRRRTGGSSSDPSNLNRTGQAPKPLANEAGQRHDDANHKLLWRGVS